MKYWATIISVIYLLSPIDLLPERAFGRLGLIDDFLIAGTLYWYYFLRPAAQRPRDRVGGEKKEARAGEEPARDPYSVLGVAKSASPEEIKHAYHELANKYHPDKVSHLGEEFREIAHRKFKEIRRAYEQLAPK